MTRLQRFRAYMARMNPVADPEVAIREGLYVSPPDRSVADELATRLELEPASTHLVLGGIGSGKTSELLQAAERLKTTFSATGDHIEYIDVSRRHDLGNQRLSGVLLALAGMSLVNQVRERGSKVSKKELEKAIKAVGKHATGYRIWVSEPDYQDNGPYDDNSWADEVPQGYYRYVPGVLVDPETPIPEGLQSLTQPLCALRTAYPGDDAHAVFLFDSLDRLPNPERFREAVQHDLRVLKSAGIGVVVVGPIRFIAGNDRAIAELFDHTHFQLAIDPAQPAGLAFLTEVLRRRADPSLLPDDCLESLARGSGGIMRDLLALAKRVGDEAYAAGHDPITPEDVSRAIDAFGRSLAIGLDDEQIKTLRHLRRSGGFVVRGERDLSLLETRRVLFYEQNRWVVHPALAPLLDAIPEAA